MAIVFSGMISISLTPMLCARLLKDEHGASHNRFYVWSEATFDRIQSAYDRSLRWSQDHGRIILGAFAVSLVLSVVLMGVMQQDFLPSDDTGRLQANIQANNGTSYRQMGTYTQQVAKIVGQDPDVEGVLAQMDGANGNAGNNQSRLMLIALKPQSQRKSGPDAIIRRLRRKCPTFPASMSSWSIRPPSGWAPARRARPTSTPCRAWISTSSRNIPTN